MKFIFFQVFYIKFDNLFYSTDNDRVKIVAIQRKTLTHATVVGWKLGSESIQGDLVVIIKVLQNTDYLSNRIDIRISSVLDLMQAGSVLCI